MAFVLRYLALTAFLTSLVDVAGAQASGSGTTTRYWDCCKPSCAWNDLATLGITSAVQSCDINDDPLTSTSVQSGCAGGTAYMCSDQTPWGVTDDLAYGFAAVSASSPKCCQCYQLTFTSGPISGKQMIVQATNTGGDVGATQFDIAMPGGGMGVFDGCTAEWSATSATWGAQYGGPSVNTCASFPSKLQAGCNFRWGWFQGADNPTVDWEEVSCPADITARSGCTRIGDTGSGPVSIEAFTPYAATVTAAPVPSRTAATTPVVNIHMSPSSSPAPVHTSVSSSAQAVNVQESSSTTTLKPYTAPAASSPAAASISSTATTFLTLTSPASSVEAPAPTETDDYDTCEL